MSSSKTKKKSLLNSNTLSKSLSKSSSGKLTRKKQFFERYNNDFYKGILDFLNKESLANLSITNKNLHNISENNLNNLKINLLNKYKKKIVKIIDLDSPVFLSFNVTNLNKKDKEEFFKLAKQRKRYNSLENNKKLNIFIIKNLLETGFIKLKLNGKRIKFTSKKTIYIFKFKFLNNINLLVFELNKNNELQLIENKLIIDYFKYKYLNK